MIKLSRDMARRFLLYHHGLLGEARFSGSEGVMAFVRQAGCVQFDPVDVCGRSPELVFLARVPDYRAEMLEDLLYRGRRLLDYFDKNLAILLSEEWPYFRRARERYALDSRSFEQITRVRGRVLQKIRLDGPQDSSQLGLPEKVDWYWSRTTLARAVLEQLYFSGELVIHHKKGNIKTYDLAERCLPEALLNMPEPLPDDLDHQCFRALRRIRAVGLMWNRASDAWLGIPDFKAAARGRVFERLQAQRLILPVQAEGVGETLWMAASDAPTMEKALGVEDPPPRCSFIAPLDSLIWDRKLIAALFRFQYTWEVYTPKEKRRYGSYVLPILYGDAFIGRIEPVCDRRAGILRIRGLWWEEGRTPGQAAQQAVNDALARLAAFNGCALEAP